MNIFDSTALLRRGAVVSCHFPLAENPDCPGPSARPALIVNVFLDRADLTWKALVAYGTSRDTRANVGFEVRVRHPASLAAAGLHRPTRFTLSRMRVLPIDRRFFAYSRNGAPVLGYLDSDLLDRLARTCEILSQSDKRLRILVDSTDGAVEAGRALKPAPSKIPAVWPLVDVGPIDRFMQSALTGRASVKSAASAQSAQSEQRTPAPARPGGAANTTGVNARRPTLTLRS